MAIAESHREAVSTHTGGSEQIKSAYRETDSKTIVLTDQRLLVINDRSETNRDTQSIKSIFLSSIDSVKITSRGPEDVDTDKLVNAAVLGLAALGTLVVVAGISDSLSQIQIISVIGAGILMGAFAADQYHSAHQTDEGHIEIDIYTTDSLSNNSVKLPTDKQSFAYELSKTVADNRAS